jgi:repressor LexA
MNNLGNKKTMANNINYYMKKRGVSRTQLSNTLNVAYTTLTDWLNAKTYPRIDKIELLANYFGVEKSDLVEERNTTSNSYRNISNLERVSFMSIPLYDSISCGTGSFVYDDIIERVNIPSDSLSGDSSDYFAQRAKGDSMIDAGIHDGDLLVFQKTSFIEDNQIGSFCIDDGIATCKKFKSGKSFIQLIPMNRNYDPIVIELNDINFRVVGVLKLLIKEFK